MAHSSRNVLLFIAACTASLLLSACVYLPGLPGAFVFDDIGTIANNQALRLGVLSVEGTLHAILSAPVGGLMRPLSTLTFLLDAHFFGISPLPFKITNIVIHLAVGALLWFLSRELLRAYRISSGKNLGDSSIAWLSLAVSTLWLVHPLNLTSVLYSVQRDTSLSALFTVAAILCYLVGRRRGREGTGGHWLIWVLTPTFMLMGMLCKENAALTPVYILTIEFTLASFRTENRKSRREVIWFFILFLILPLLAACCIAILQPGFFFRGYTLRDFTLYERVLSECRILLDYLRWAFVPDIRQLGLFHDDISPSRGLMVPATTLPSVICIVILLVVACAIRKRAPLFSFGVLWFFAGHLMESTILPLELAFEHRNYLPLFGLFLGGVGTLYPLAAEAGKTSMAKLLIATCILLFSFTTALRAADWQNELTFARSESRHHPRSARALAELGWAYVDYIVATKDTRFIPQALDAAERSKAADHGSINQDIGLAYMYASLHDLPKAQLRLQAAADEVSAATPSSTLQLALQTLLSMDGADDESLRPVMTLIFQRAVDTPKFMGNPCYGAEIWNSFAIFKRQLQDVPGALGAMHKAVTMCPRDTLMRMNFTDMLLSYGDTKDAGPQLDVLRDQHDLRYLSETARLQKEYDRQVATQVKK